VFVDQLGFAFGYGQDRAAIFKGIFSVPIFQFLPRWFEDPPAEVYTVQPVMPREVCLCESPNHFSILRIPFSQTFLTNFLSTYGQLPPSPFCCLSPLAIPLFPFVGDPPPPPQPKLVPIFRLRSGSVLSPFISPCGFFFYPVFLPPGKAMVFFDPSVFFFVLCFFPPPDCSFWYFFLGGYQLSGTRSL